MSRFSAQRAFVFSLVALLCAILFDLVASPIILSEHISSRLTPAVVILIGIRRGPWRGLAAGWFAGFLIASITAEHLGQSMLSLGAVGFATILARRPMDLGLPILDILVFFGLLMGEGVLAAIVAFLGQGLVGGVGLGGILLATAVGSVSLLSHPPGEARRQEQQVNRPADAGQMAGL